MTPASLVASILLVVAFAAMTAVKIRVDHARGVCIAAFVFFTTGCARLLDAIDGTEAGVKDAGCEGCIMFGSDDSAMFVMEPDPDRDTKESGNIEWSVSDKPQMTFLVDHSKTIAWKESLDADVWYCGECVPPKRDR